MGPGIQALHVHVRDRWYVTLFIVTYFYTRHYYPDLELRRLNSITKCSQATDLCFCPVQNRLLQSSILAGCPRQLIHKLQKGQNNSARIICRTPKSDHTSPVLHALHWLPVEQRIEYKLLPLAFKYVNNDGLSYLYDILKFYIPSRQLRSSSFAFFHSVWNPLDNANSRIRPLFYGTLSRSHSVIPTLH